MKIELKQGDEVLERFANGLGALGDYRARQVMARALNRAGNPSATKVRRAIAKHTSIPYKMVEKGVVVRKAWSGTEAGPGKLSFTLHSTGYRLALRHFRPVEFRYGVRAKVWGKFQRFEGAFMRGGAWPNRKPFEKKGMDQNVWVRTDKARLPIRRMYGPSIPGAMLDAAIVKVWRTATARLGDDIAHELDRALSRFS